MAMIVWSDGEKLGEISDWVLTERFAEVRNVLGKEILMAKPKDQCQFESPKPIHHKSKVWIIENNKIKHTLSELKVKGGTFVVATVQRTEKV